MIFQPTPIRGACVVRPVMMSDERGFFARTWCRREFAEHGIDREVVQCGLSHNPRRGTLRGMHYQVAPHAEAKLVRCTRGSLHDVIIDLRPDSPSFRRHFGLELNAEERIALFVPEGCAHGYLTLEDDTEVSYQMSADYDPPSARGVRWDDPAFGLVWPGPVLVIAERDRTYPDYAVAGADDR